MLNFRRLNMLVNHRYKFIFVHIPKTAGGTFRTFNRKRLARWYSKGWEEINGAHGPMTREIANRYPDYFKFAIFRNPWKLVASGYRFDTEGISFNKRTGQVRKRDVTILEWLMERETDHSSGPFPNQMAYVSDSQGMLVDRICLQERLADDMRDVLGRLGIKYHPEDWEQPKRHFYGDYDWKAYFVDPAVREMVRKLCEKDFAYGQWEADLK
jgi:signal recognition particle subunit SEC65